MSEQPSESRATLYVKDSLQEAYQKLAPNLDSLLLAVSGGPDSVALLHATMQLDNEGRLPVTLDRIAVAHLNHGWRGEESDGDAEFVKDLAAQYGIECHVHCLDRSVWSSIAGETLEEAARRIRYEFLIQKAEQGRFAAVATGHNLGDQVETVLHNLIRGTGLRGVQGMRSSRSLASRVSLIRPFLTLERQMIVRFLSESGFIARNDYTNTDMKRTRNRIRHRLIPVLQVEINKNAVEHLASFADHVAAAIDCLDTLATQVLAECLVEKTTASCRLDRSAIGHWPRYLINHSLILLWIEMGWPRQKMTASHWRRLSEVVVSLSDTDIDFPSAIHVCARGSLMQFMKP